MNEWQKNQLLQCYYDLMVKTAVIGNNKG